MKNYFNAIKDWQIIHEGLEPNRADPKDLQALEYFKLEATVLILQTVLADILMKIVKLQKPTAM